MVFKLFLKSIRFVEEHVDTLKPLFKLDPLLIYAVLCFCPRKDVTLLFDHVPVHLALGRIAYQLNKCSFRFLNFKPSEVSIWSICDKLCFKGCFHTCLTWRLPVDGCQVRCKHSIAVGLYMCRSAWCWMWVTIPRLRWVEPYQLIPRGGFRERGPIPPPPPFPRVLNFECLLT